MENEYCYVYCNGILGVKTNIKDFRWVYGSVAPCVSFDEYDKCVVKFEVYLKPEKELAKEGACDGRFQAYSWNNTSKTLCYRRALMSNFEIGYNIKFDDNLIRVDMGKRYLKFVKNRTMNLHGVYYLLADIANIMLLKNGFLTLYASCVHSDVNNKGVVFLAPPNTGKTLTATKLCDLPHYSMVGEDMVITDTKQLFACPWTSTYRKRSSSLDSVGAFGRASVHNDKDVCGVCDLTHLVILSLGEKKVSTDKEDFFRQACVLNGYPFVYCSSAIVRVLGYFSDEFNEPYSAIAEGLLKDMVSSVECISLQSENASDFWEIVHGEVSGESL